MKFHVKSPTQNHFKCGGAQSGWIQLPVYDFCLNKTPEGWSKGGQEEKEFMAVWTTCLLERERSGCFSTPPARKRFLRAGKRGRRERERVREEIYKVWERVWGYRKTV